MSYFTKERSLYLIIIILVLLNIVTLGSMWLWKIREKPGLLPPPPENFDGMRFLVKELKLTPAQREKFIESRDNHFKLVSKLSDEIRINKELLFSMVEIPSPDTNKVNEVTSKIGELQKQIDIETFKHFAKLQSVCNDEQKKKFGTLIKEVLKRMGHQQRIGPPHEIKDHELPPGIEGRKPPMPPDGEDNPPPLDLDDEDE
jgi:Spy/CpxP family protein refolding chaperone